MKKLLLVFVLMFGLTQVYGIGAPSTPTGLNNPDATDGSLTLNWDRSLNAEEYIIYLEFRTVDGTVYYLSKTVADGSTTTVITEFFPLRIRYY